MTSAAEILLPVIQGKLDGQRDAPESARTRAAVALTASGVIAGLFVTRLGKGVDNWELAALAAQTTTAPATTASISSVRGGRNGQQSRRTERASSSRGRQEPSFEPQGTLY
jgi:hypothetical protein